jgi:hypothetical protein
LGDNAVSSTFTIDCEALGRFDDCRILGRSATIFMSDQQGMASEFILLCA